MHKIINVVDEVRVDQHGNSVAVALNLLIHRDSMEKPVTCVFYIPGDCVSKSKASITSFETYLRVNYVTSDIVVDGIKYTGVVRMFNNEEKYTTIAVKCLIYGRKIADEFTNPELVRWFNS